MRAARVVTSPGLILAAHGSADPRSSAVAQALAGRIRRLRPGLEVRVAFLERSEPPLAEVLSEVERRQGTAVIVPMLLASAYHARVDIPAAIAASGAAVGLADVLGEDPALIFLLGQRLAEAGVSAQQRDVGIVVAAVGSSDPQANARTSTVARALASRAQWAHVEIAFATGPKPTLAEAADSLRRRGVQRMIVAPWFLAHGRLTDRLAKSAAALHISMSEPLGAHNLVAATLLDRFDEATASSIAA